VKENEVEESDLTSTPEAAISKGFLKKIEIWKALGIFGVGHVLVSMWFVF
jgi:hypothetical protein